MKRPNEKTIETRAHELYVMVNGNEQANEFNAINPAVHRGWLKLGKFVLELERKWSAVKRKPTGFDRHRLNLRKGEDTEGMFKP